MKRVLLGLILIFGAASLHAYPTDLIVLKSTFVYGTANANANLTKVSTGNIVVVDYTTLSTSTVNTALKSLTLDVFDSGQATATAVKSWLGFPLQTPGQQVNLNIEVTSGAYVNINGLDAGTTVYLRYYRKSKN